MGRQVDKVVAAHLLEATREAVDHLSRCRIELTESGREAAPDLAHSYGRVRRLRDYLQRSVAAYMNPVDLDLDEDDENMLAACALHAAALVDQALAGADANDSRRPWVEERRRCLADLASELASRPIDRLPGGDDVRLSSPTARAVLAAVQQRLAAQAPRPQPASGIFRRVATPTESAPVGLEAAALAGGARFGEPIGSAPSAAATPPPAAAVVPPSVHEQIVDPRRLRDPRLRAILAMDLRAHERCLDDEDLRMALVHLASILESVLLDQAVARRAELGLNGPPESWPLGELLERLAGSGDLSEHGGPIHLLAAHSLVRPARQLEVAMAVTPAVVTQSRAFVARLVRDLGYAGSASGTWAAAVPTGPASGLQRAAVGESAGAAGSSGRWSASPRRFGAL